MSTSLRRSIGPVRLTLYGLGTVLGAGIYVLVGEVAAQAGVWAPLSFFISAAIAAICGLSFGELAARYPESAGEAAYVQAGFRIPQLSALVGFAVAVTGVVSAAAIAVGFAGYLKIFVAVPPELAVAGLLLGLGTLAAVGVDASVTAAVIMTLIEVAGLILVVFATRAHLFTLPEKLPQLLAEPPSPNGVLIGAFLAFYAFIGFEDMVNSAEEVKDPERTLPLSIMAALVASTLLYVVVALIAVLALPVEELAGAEAPLSTLYAQATGNSPWLITAISLVAVSNGALVQIVMASRVVYGLSRKGWLPAQLGAVSSRTQTPLLATALVTLVVLVLALLFPIKVLAQATSFIILVIFAIAQLALVALKTRGEPSPSLNLPRWVPLLGATAALGFVALRALTWLLASP